MTRPLSQEDVLFRQRLLSCSGLYDRKLDGLWGKHTDDADRAFFAQCDAIALATRSFDPRTERNIRTLRLDAQPMCRQSLAAISIPGKEVRIISGTRTYPEQAALYRQGRNGNPGPRVTNARAGQSWHNFGLAWDIGIFRGGDYLTGGPEYDAAGPKGLVPGVEWGGNWRTFVDKPHFQTPFGAHAIAEARGAFERGGRPG
jgi:peptidoglycan L-alanyl-D-glutamate endopeptidase CwlK